MGLPIPEPDEPRLHRRRARVGAHDPHRPRRGIPDEEILELLRVLGRGLSQAAETLRALPLKLVLEPGHQRARARRAATRRRPSSSTRCVDPLLQQHADPAPAPRDAERGDQRGRAQRRASCPARARSPSASPTWSASRASARKSRRTSSAAWRCAWKRSPPRSPSRRCGSSRRSATRRCSPRPSPSRCSTPRSR